MILQALQNRGQIHLTPQETQALWRLTQAVGKFFWHMGPVAQGVTVGVPSFAGFIWMHRWDPLNSKPEKRR